MGSHPGAAGLAGMNAAFFGLAGLAALDPELLIIDLILAGNQRPRPMFACFLLGGIGLGVGVGLPDVFVLRADAIKTQGHASARLDLALGIPLLAVGALLASNRLRAGEAIKRFKVWLTSHERQIAAAVALISGGYMVISGLVRLS